MNDTTMNFAPLEPVRILTIIRLTNHAPVRVLLDEWKTFAEGFWSNGHEDDPDHREIAIKVLYLRGGEPSCAVGDGTAIIQAWAKLDDPDDDCKAERVYAGCLLTFEESVARGSCDPHILAVADDLRERIKDEQLRRRATEVVDACFASFEPWDMGNWWRNERRL